MNAKSFIKRAKALANVMTQTKNVEVTVSGTGAYRLPGAINIPNGDFSDSDWVAMVHGWIDHELGHEAHTKHDVFIAAARESMVMKNMLNCIEDIRMEKVVGENFIGAKKNLSRLAELAIERELFVDPDKIQDLSPLGALSAFCLYYGRYQVIGQPCLSDYANKAYNLLVDLLGNKISDKVKSLVGSVEKARSTSDAYDIAKAILTLLEDELEDDSNDDSESSDSDGDSNDDSESSDSDGDSNDDGESSDSDGDSNDDGESSDSDGDSNDDSESSDSDGDSNDDGESSDSDGDSNDDSESSDSDGDSNDDGESSKPDIIKAIQAILSSDEQIEDFHQKLAEFIGEDSKDSACSGEGFNHVHRSKETYHKETMLDVDLAKKMSGGLFRVLQKTLFDRAATNTVFKKTGKRIENRKLSGISQGRFNVFKHKSEQRDITSAVSVLVDVSSSMTQARMISANTSALALTKALSRLGVKVEVATFGRSDGRGLINGIIKAFDDRYVKDSNFGTISRGGTPTGDSMAKAIEDLLLRSETNKILFVLTDGEPVNANTVRYATSIAQELDIKVIPVGLDVKTVGGFANDDVVFCQDASDIIRAIKDGVQRKLFN